MRSESANGPARRMIGVVSVAIGIVFGAAIILSLTWPRTRFAVPRDYATIEAAIAAAPAGACILVAPGRYVVGLAFDAKALSVVADPPGEALLVAARGGVAARFARDVTWQTRLEGFDIVGGIVCEGSPTLRRNRLDGRDAAVAIGVHVGPGAAPVLRENEIIGFRGRGVSIDRGAARLSRNVIRGNGGGVLVRGAARGPVTEREDATADERAGDVVELRGNRIVENRADDGAGLCVVDAIVRSTCDMFAGNIAKRGGGLSAQRARVELLHATIAANEAERGGGAVIEGGRFGARRSILWGNRGAQGPSIANEAGSAITIRESNVEGGWTGRGNFAIDPRFADLAAGDLHLTASSPCRDRLAGSVAGTARSFRPDDIDGDRCGDDRPDVGADEFAPTLYVHRAGERIFLKVAAPPTARVLVGVSPPALPYPSRLDRDNYALFAAHRFPLRSIPPTGIASFPAAAPADNAAVRFQIAVDGRLTNAITLTKSPHRNAWRATPPAASR